MLSAIEQKGKDIAQQDRTGHNSTRQHITRPHYLIWHNQLFFDHNINVSQLSATRLGNRLDTTRHYITQLNRTTHHRTRVVQVALLLDHNINLTQLVNTILRTNRTAQYSTILHKTQYYTRHHLIT